MSGVASSSMAGTAGVDMKLWWLSLKFEFGSQERRSWNPLNSISAVKIELSANEDETVDDSGGSQEPDDESELRIIGWFPRSARSTGSERLVKKSVAVALDPSALGVSGGSLSISRASEGTVVRHANLSSYRNGDLGVVWKLEEEEERSVASLTSSPAPFCCKPTAWNFLSRYNSPCPSWGSFIVERPRCRSRISSSGSGREGELGI